MWPHDRKLNRAAEHFKQLDAQIKGWEKGQGYTLRVQPDPDPPHYIVRAELDRPVEDEPFPLVLGDFLQNARASLDYIAVALGDVGAGGVMAEREATATMFPITRSAEQFAQVVQRRLPTISQPVRAAIEDLQPYKTGADLWASEPLWVLNELARLDRHRSCMSAASGSGCSNSTAPEVATSGSRISGSPRGRFPSRRSMLWKTPSLRARKAGNKAKTAQYSRGATPSRSTPVKK